MANKDYGSGVSRTLDAYRRQFRHVVWQKGRPPLDSELSLQDDISSEMSKELVSTMLPSGFFMDPTRTVQDYQTDPLWANQIKLGNPRVPFGSGEAAEQDPVLWANVNGWVIPVCGSTTVEGDLANIIKLYPPPESDTRIDFIFLEAWATRVDANPSTVNKPSASTIWKFGNTKYGGTNLADDLEDPTIGYETTARVQIQYRLRVHGQGTGLGASVALDVYPEGLDDPNVLGQGTAALPVGGDNFVNMREALGDPSLWRAGSGDPNNSLGTIDGYTYAVPVCAIFRRCSNVYMAVNTAGNPNHNGAFNRTPSSKFLPDPLLGARVLLQATLTNDLSPTDALDPAGADAMVNVTNLNGCGLEDTHHVLTSVFLVLENEIVGISALDLVAGTITIPAGGRGRYGTAAVGHAAATEVGFFNTRPDGLYSDQVAAQDIMDMRHAVNPNDWDFGRLLEHNVAALLKGDLHATWKHAAAGNTQGPETHEITYLYGDGSIAVPNHTEAADGPDGIRTIWSDAATIQPDVTVLLNNEAIQDGGNVGLTNANTFTSGAGFAWDVGAGFYPSGFMNVFGQPATDVFCNGTTLLLFTGGLAGSGGARATFRDGDTRAVRAVTPKEYWKSGYPIVDPANGNQHPVTLRFLEERANEQPPTALSSDARKARHVGPFSPYRETNFEKPFIVLGGMLRPEMRITAVATADMTTVGTVSTIDVGIDFDALGDYYSLDAAGNIANDPTAVSSPLLRGKRTLYGMLTADGTDYSGYSSEVYVVIYGDNASNQNNGCWKVIGAGTVPYTASTPSAATEIRVVSVCAEFTAFDSATGNTVTVEFRSQETNADDVSSYNTKVADMAIVLTDIGGLTEHPWKREYLGHGYNYDISMPFVAARAAVESQLLISMALLYHPGRGGMVRIPDELVRFSMKGGTTDTNGAYLRQSPASLDTTFSAVGTPTDETNWQPSHVQLWNRLPGLGWNAPLAPNYGGEVIGYTEQDRENELFFDRGSKTVLFRPFRDRRMTLQEQSFVDVIAPVPIPANRCLFGEYTYNLTSVAKDALLIWTGAAGSQDSTGKKMGFPVPYEFMPRFGRQDIPYYVDQASGTGPFLSGINHLFKDEADTTSPVFNIIGGHPTAASVPAVYSMFFATGNIPDGGGGVLPWEYGRSGTMPAYMQTLPFIWARRAPEDINTVNPFAQGVVNKLAAVNSSDFGKGLKGIQLPPYYGIARLYGVYDVRDFDAKGGRSFQANRIDPETDPVPNLLRQDATQQTLFILQGGAKDFGESDGDHTYLIPFNALDITRAVGYIDGDVPEDYHYVVECSTFGFARGFIDQNNLVTVRKFGGTGLGLDGTPGGNVDGDDLEIRGVHMVLPCPAAYHDQFYAAYNRTVYQGDPYMSRGGAKTESDYETRYGQLSVGAQYAMRMPIEQYDANGDFVPEIPNAHAFEVLASLDFYTTMGTGKIGGQLYPGTPLDVGFTEANAKSAHRYMDEVDVPFRVLPRAFTEGQKTNTSRASLDLYLLYNAGLNPTATDYFTLRIGLLDGTAVDLWAATDANAIILQAAPWNIPAEDIFTVNETRTIREVGTGSLSFPNPTEIAPGQVITDTVTVAGASLMADSVLVSTDTSPLVKVRGWVSAADTVTLQYFNIWTPAAFLSDPGGDPSVADVAGVTLPVVGAGAMLPVVALTALPGAAPTQKLVVHYSTVAAETGLLFTAEVTAPGTVQVFVHNPTVGPLGGGAPVTLRFGMLDPMDLTLYTYDMGGETTFVRVLKTDITGGLAERTVVSLADRINGHSKLKQTISATPQEQMSFGGNKVRIEAIPTGKAGRGVTVAMRGVGAVNPQSIARMEIPHDNTVVRVQGQSMSPLLGGDNLPMNAGDGTSQINITGMTERLPMGALLQDSDFLCENPLNDTASAVKTSPTGPRPIQTVMPLTSEGGGYTRFFGEPGELLALADGSISVTSFGAWRQTSEGGGGPTGSRRFRLYRGGGSAFTLSGDYPGAPIDWVSDTFPSAFEPVLKGGILGCRAMLVRNYREDVTPSGSTYKVTDGDEIQMVVITNGILGDGQSRTEGVNLGGSISPSGYGEGWAAADRFRIDGKPMFKGYSRAVPNPADVELVVYPDEQR